MEPKGDHRRQKYNSLAFDQRPLDQNGPKAVTVLGVAALVRLDRRLRPAQSPRTVASKKVLTHSRTSETPSSFAVRLSGVIDPFQKGSSEKSSCLNQHSHSGTVAPSC